MALHVAMQTPEAGLVRGLDGLEGGWRGGIADEVDLGVETVGATAYSSGGSTITTIAPSGVATGDLLVLCYGYDGAGPATTPTGWTYINGGAQHYNTCYSSMYYRVADGTGDDTPVVTHSGTANAAAVILRVVGSDTADVVDVSGFNKGGYGTQKSITEVTTTVDGTLFIAMQAANAGTLSSGPSGGYTVAWEDDDTQDPPIVVYYKMVPSAGAVGGELVTWTGTNNECDTDVAINPA